MTRERWWPAVPELLCGWFWAYVMGKWVWISVRNMEVGQTGRRCVREAGHEGSHTIGDLGHEVPVPRSDVLRERAREVPLAAAARRRVAAEDQRRAAAKALDRYISIVFEPGSARELEPAFTAAGNEFVERVGDYVLSRLQQKSHYDALADEQACMCGTAVGLSGCSVHAEGPSRQFQPRWQDSAGAVYGGDNPDGVR